MAQTFTPETGRAGTVAILGRPNVGKSTLLNRIVGTKLAIVSTKPQTTRHRIVGVWNGPAAQIVFVDTPGFHAARSALNRFMLEETLGALAAVDVALLVVEAQAAGRALPAAARRFDADEARILELLGERRVPILVAINKVDALRDKAALLPQLEAWQARAAFASLVPISARKGTGVDALVSEIVKILPVGAPLYGPDMLTDRTERFLAGELVREQLFSRLRQELPYATSVVVEDWQERSAQNDVVITAFILVERDSQKGIVVGKGGAMIRDVGSAARKEIAELLGRPVHLKLEVKVLADWSDSAAGLVRAGYERTRQ